MTETISGNDRQNSDCGVVKSFRPRKLSVTSFPVPDPIEIPLSLTAVEELHSAEEMQAALTEHVMSCRHCLAMALFRDETLAEIGCDEYKDLLANIHAICRMRVSSPSHCGEEQSTADEYAFESSFSH